MNWNYKQPVEIHFETGILNDLKELTAKSGYSRGLLVTSPSFVKRGVVDRLRAFCEGRICAVFDGVMPNPDVIQVDACAALARKEKCDFIIALGGGSVLDCAKVVSVLALCEKSASDFVGKTVDIPSGHLPLIAVPTTAGTGSEVTSVAVISDHARGVKVPLAADSFFPAMAIVDPELTYSASPYLTACCGVDALCHAIEAYWSRHHQPVCDALAVKAVKMLLANIEDAVSTDYNKSARNNMSEASLIAGLAFAIPKTSSAHACSYPLTNLLGIPHGEACGLTIDHWIRFNYSHGDGRIIELAEALGFRSPDELADRIGEIKKYTGLRTTLADMKLSDAKLQELIEGCKHPNMLNNPVKVEDSDIVALMTALARG